MWKYLCVWERDRAFDDLDTLSSEKYIINDLYMQSTCSVDKFIYLYIEW